MIHLCGLVAEILGVEPSSVTPDTGPGALPQWDSMAHMQIIAAVEETYGVQFTTEEMINVMSVNDLASCLTARGVTVG